MKDTFPTLSHQSLVSSELGNPIMTAPSIDREHALAFRQQATHLDKRLPLERLTEAAFAGLQDSSPRSAVLALHARVENVLSSAWKDPWFVQVWGSRGAVYVVPKDEVAIFTIGFLPRDPALGESSILRQTGPRRYFVPRKIDSPKSTFMDCEKHQPAAR